MRKWEDSLKERLAASPAFAAEYLSAVLEENDPAALRLALRHVAEARGAVIVPPADTAEGGAALKHLAAALDGLGMQLLVAPKQAAGNA